MPFISQKQINWACDTIRDLLREWKRLHDENESLKREIQQLKENTMHYRNGREAKNGDKIVMVNGGTVVAFGVLHSATPGNDYCNGEIAVMHQAEMACMCDCLHVDDLAEVLATQGLDKRPEGM